MFLISTQTQKNLRLFFGSALILGGLVLLVSEPRYVRWYWWVWFGVSSVGWFYARMVDTYDVEVVVGGPPGSKVPKGTRLDAEEKNRVWVTLKSGIVADDGEVTLYCKSVDSTDLLEIGNFTIRKANDQ
jgi:hypothetical protein